MKKLTLPLLMISFLTLFNSNSSYGEGIKFKALNGKSIDISVPAGTTLEELKQTLAAIFDMSSVRIVYATREVKDIRTITENKEGRFYVMKNWGN